MKPFNLSQHQHRNAINVMDWPYNAKCDGVTDDTAALNAAIAAVPATGGTIHIPGVMAISSTIVVQKPINFEGTTEGSAYQPVQPPSTGFKWIGTAVPGPMMRIGLYGTGTKTLWGGGLRHLRFDGGGICGHGLEIADACNGEYTDVFIWNCPWSGLHMISDGTKDSPVMSNSFYSLYIDQRAGGAATVNAHGILIEAVNGAGQGVTLCYFEDVKIHHANGDGIRWNTGGDGFVFMKPHIYRHDSETGWGVHFASTDIADICNHCIFYYPIVSGGFYFAKAGLHTGTAINDLDHQNMAASMGISPVQGPGASEVHGNTTFGMLLGQSRLLSNQDVLKTDSMNFLKYDGAVFPALLLTTEGTWPVYANGGAAGIINHPGTNGGGCRMVTNAIANDSITIAHCHPVASGGLLANQWPSVQFVIDTPTPANSFGRWGFFSNNLNPPTAGAWIEYNSADGGVFRLISADGGPWSSILNTFGFTAATNRGRWRIDLMPGCVNFYFSQQGASTPQFATLFASFTTNVPTAPLFCGVILQTNDAVAKQLDVLDIKLAHRLDFR